VSALTTRVGCRVCAPCQLLGQLRQEPLDQTVKLFLSDRPARSQVELEPVKQTTRGLEVLHRVRNRQWRNDRGQSVCCLNPSFGRSPLCFVAITPATLLPVRPQFRCLPSRGYGRGLGKSRMERHRGNYRRVKRASAGLAAHTPVQAPGSALGQGVFAAGGVSRPSALGCFSNLTALG
jgi:hypothetical protein